MQTIIITGPSANCGKTAVACQLISALPNAQALKITRFHRESHCPVHGVDSSGDDNCDGCAPAPDGYQLISDPEILNTSGKDTSRMQAAGASKTLWLRAAPHVFEYAIKKATREFAADKPLIIEGNSATNIEKVQGKVVVVWPMNLRGVKESVYMALKQCDLLLLPANDGDVPQSLTDTCSRLKIDIPRQREWISSGHWSSVTNDSSKWIERLLGVR